MNIDSRGGSPPWAHGETIEGPSELPADFAFNDSIGDRFHEAARRFSSRLAIQDTTRSLTYAELAALVDQIAGATTVATQGRTGPVAILLAADANLPAAMLGILAAGRSYLPLDADSPVERNALIVSEAGACALISNRDVLARTRATFPRDLALIDIHDLPTPLQPSVMARAEPGDLAAIYYTSGSSGVPKGVAWSHRNLLHWVDQFGDVAQISPADRTLLLFSASVSASYRSIYCALLGGASLHILPPRDLGPARLAREIRARKITIYHSIPRLVGRIAESLGSGDRLDSVRVACIGGDRVQWSDVDECRRSFAKDVRVYTILSSTETGPYIHGFVDDSLRATTAHPPVGRPAPGWSVTIAGDGGRPVPDGEVGNIVVTSRFTALGLWRGSDQRVVAFPRDPADPLGCVFASQDRARRRHDGLIEFVGRNDQQIKLRGYRIELDEVEFAFAACAGVKDAAIVVRRDERDVPRSLAAFVETRPGHERLRPRELRSMLSKRLPFYMIPATIRMVDDLPRLDNFKIDRVRLAEMDAARLAKTVDATDDPLIAQVVEIFEAALGNVSAAPEDNIWSLGGDSLQAIRVAIRLESHFGIAIPPDVFVASPTIRELARWFAARKAPASSTTGS
jgi:acyl-coenzyme A synthetase/AMP-(fatty) acid ligase/acyl carrier protein